MQRKLSAIKVLGGAAAFMTLAGAVATGMASCAPKSATGAGGTAGAGAAGPGTTQGSSGTTAQNAVASSTTGSGPCPDCISPSDCGANSACAQLGPGSFCAPLCNNGTCPTGQECQITVDAGGQQVSVCVVPSSVCSNPTTTAATTGATTSVTSGGTTSSSTGGGQMCGPYIGPNSMAGCHSCSSTSPMCQPNGCYGGWWCDSATNKCHAPPTNCGSSTTGATTGTTSGATTGATTANTTVGVTTGSGGQTGTITGSGGTASSLYFTIVGDTRPASIGDTAGYPTAIITKIYQDIEALNPRPLFSVSTGDYMFASVGTNEANAQLDLYLGARANFSGVFFPAMGNHECTGATASNCASTTTTNLQAFMTKMLGPIQQQQPYYSVNINSTSGSWTSKFVFIAANAWDSTQASWLQQTLSQPTTYTFVLRHEPAAATTAPGTSPSEQIMNQYPYTLALTGHTHTYNKFLVPQQIVVGNGGAPITGGVNYGFALVQQRSDGNIVVDMIDYMTGQSDPSFHFVVTPTGALTQ